MRWIAMGACLLLSAQSRIRLGREFSPQNGLGGVDTVFRLASSSLYVWAEVRVPQPLEWDTLWVALRTAERAQGVFLVVRTKADRRLYRGRLAFRRPGIYLITLMPPRQARLVLGRSKVYVTNAQYPTVAALRAQARQSAVSTPAGNPEAALSTVDTTQLEIIEIPDDALIAPEGGLAPIDDSVIEDDIDSLMEMPVEGLETEEEIDLEELDLGDDL